LISGILIQDAGSGTGRRFDLKKSFFLDLDYISVKIGASSSQQKLMYVQQDYKPAKLRFKLICDPQDLSCQSVTIYKCFEIFLYLGQKCVDGGGTAQARVSGSLVSN